MLRMTVRRDFSGGRPSKGDRDAMMIRPARSLGTLVREEAERRDMTISDYVATLLAEAHDRPDLAPTPPRRSTDKELPFDKSA